MLLSVNGLGQQHSGPSQQKKQALMGPFFDSYMKSLLLQIVVIFVVVLHALTENFYGLQFLQHDRLAALGADASCHMVDLFAVRQRGTSCL